MSRQHIGKETDHQGKRFGEDAEELDERHHRYRHFQPPRHIRPEDIFPVMLGSEDIDCKEGTDSKHHRDRNVSRHVRTSGEERNQPHDVINENEEKRSQQIRSELPVVGSDTALDDIVVHHHDKHFHESDEAARCQCPLRTFPVPVRHTQHNYQQ